MKPSQEFGESRKVDGSVLWGPQSDVKYSNRANEEKGRNCSARAGRAELAYEHSVQKTFDRRVSHYLSVVETHGAFSPNERLHGKVRAKTGLRNPPI